jgi:hypothetical protein
MRPQHFYTEDPDNDVTKLELSFENICASLEEAGIAQPHKLSTFKFYSRIQYFKKKNEKKP